MALINQPPVPNLWGQPVQNRGPEMIFQALMQDARLQVARHGMLQRALKELDPVTFFKDAHMVEQSRRIGQIENQVTDISKKRRGRLTQRDLLEIDHQILSFKNWQAGAQKNIQKFAQDEALFKSKPGFYKADVFLASAHELFKNGDYI